jgi:hypothetical protein
VPHPTHTETTTNNKQQNKPNNTNCENTKKKMPRFLAWMMMMID